ncbi:MAG: GNAT family N-acetyltransferase [Rhodospirillales bacterium]|jgi:ribosomal protein S18 acetylase RimI-like enzyme|nr:GNAT family N-acetyltransferase [Rhodospirillales bacterium]
MPSIEYISAVKEDCRDIARLYQIAAEGVADYIWSTIAEPNENLLDVGTRRYVREGVAFSYENCRVAVKAQKVVGMTLAFPIHIDPESPGVDDDPVTAPYNRLEEDSSLYLAGIAVNEDCRGHGIGKQLMEMFEEDAADREYKKTSLIVFEQNTGAKRLYENLGYSENKRATIVPHKYIHASGDALLMVKNF